MNILNSINNANCPVYYHANFIGLKNKDKFCNTYWHWMTKYKTLGEAIQSLPTNKIAFRCAIVARREKKTRWKEMESLIALSDYAKRLYFEYMQRLNERGTLSADELMEIRTNIGMS